MTDERAYHAALDLLTRYACEQCPTCTQGPLLTALSDIAAAYAAEVRRTAREVRHSARLQRRLLVLVQKHARVCREVVRVRREVRDLRRLVSG